MKQYFSIGLIFLGLLFSEVSKAQSSLCENIEPFCAGSGRLTFPNSNQTNSTQANGEEGPAYGCLEQQYYPAWFYLQIEDSGNLKFNISQTTNSDQSGIPLDVDFIVWGPFHLGDDFCNALTEDMIVDCSYLPDAVETMTINGAEANEIYIVLITNFEKLPGYISLQQIAGEGSTDCSILDKSLGDFIPVCGADQYELNGYTDEAGGYEWFKKNPSTGEYEKIPGADGPTYVVTVSGDYRLTVTDALGQNAESDDVTVTFYDIPEIGNARNVYVCDDSDTVDLTENADELISPNGNIDQYDVDYYQNESDLENDEPISNPESFPFTDGATLYARVRHIESGCLSEPASFEMGAFMMAQVNLADSTYFCMDANGKVVSPITIGEDLGEDYEYEWKIGTETRQEPQVTLTEFPDPAQIDLTITHSQTGCEINLSTTPVKIPVPDSIDIDISGSDFGEGYTLTGNINNLSGSSEASYWYRLDNKDWQDSNVFKGVPAGYHTISARESHGCGAITSDEIFLVGYPRYFTPNSDGYNDSWKIINNNQISIKWLYVFDRYGKLIKQLSPSGNGWDGTYNGQPMPADDYWFRIEYVDGKTGEVHSYSANFSLIR